MTADFPQWKVGLPAFPHKMTDAPLTLVSDFYLEHLERDAKARRLEPLGFRVVCRGLLLGARQGYDRGVPSPLGETPETVAAAGRDSESLTL